MSVMRATMKSPLQLERLTAVGWPVSRTSMPKF
jgi:hypothetical protein